MISKPRPSLIFATGLTTLLQVMLPAQELMLADCSNQEAKTLEWRIVNDGVMGGLSKGQFEIIENGVLKFTGNLSLENNGGFSSIRTGEIQRNLAAAQGVSLRVKGDGRTYQLRFGTEARFRGMEVSFLVEFPTQKNEWVEVKLPFEEFVGSFRGRTLKDYRFEPAEIRRMGLLIADKKAGPFSLEIDWIQTYGSGKTQ